MKFTGEIHPVADLFPMLAADELSELAESISADGLLQPIVLDSTGRLLDGRNRLAACKKAKVAPTFEVYEGDPDAYALTVNVARRHLSKGQRAMVTARAGLLSKASGVEIAKLTEASTGYVSRARTVIEWAPTLVDSVVSGATPLNEAYETATAAKKSVEKKDDTWAAIVEKAPDLADLVTDEKLTLADAAAALARREQERAERIDRLAQHLRSLLTYADAFRQMCSDDNSPVEFAEFQTALYLLADEERDQIDYLMDVLK